MIRFRCPKCEAKMEVDESFGGRAARCPTCGHDLRVPKEGEPTPAAGAAQTTRPGVTTVRVGGEKVEIIPPLETLVVISLIFVSLALLSFLACLVFLGSSSVSPLMTGSLLGAVLALLGTLIGVPGYHNVKRSRGRKRGKTHVMVALLAGLVLFLGFTVAAIVSYTQVAWRAPCEENIKRIDIAMHQYAAKHEGAFPKSLNILVDEKYVDPGVVTCPEYRIQIGTPTYILTPDINVNAPQFQAAPDLMILSDGYPFEAHGDGQVRVLLLNHQILTKSLTEWATYQKVQAERWNKILNEIRNPRKPTPAEPAAPAGPQPLFSPGQKAPAAGGAPAAPAPTTTPPAGK